MRRIFPLLAAACLLGSCRPAAAPVEKRDGTVEARAQDGHPLYSRTWRSGRPHGTWREYGAGGKLVSESVYEDGVKQGTWRTWYASGQLRSEGSYVDGIEAGAWVAWHENGKPSFEAHYLNGQRFGLMRSWDKEGRLVSRDYFP